MPTYAGHCYCKSLAFTVTLDNPQDDARTSLCHCGNCKRFTGGNFGITTKIPRSAFKYTKGSGGEGTGDGEGEGKPGEQGPGGEKVITVHEADNGSGVILRREFCGRCGGGILEYGANAGDFIYIFYGTFDKDGRDALAPKGEFFTKYRDSWMPEVPGLFQKNEIKS